ncbi:MAG TPA: RNA polymerase sigma factor [Chitinophagaceae bacterium]|nr:RNA polymerase sigma factor [Chitinophagaceae bacterium]
MEQNEFNKILVDNVEYLKPFALSFTKNEDDANDLVQDTMFRALKNMHHYKEGSNIKAWLYTIMRNLFINNYRKNKRFKKVNTEAPEDYFLFETEKVARNGGYANFNLKEIRGKIARLPKIFRQSFILYYKGYKYKEIASDLDEPLGTIKSRIHFARKMLMEQIDRYE